MLEAHLNSEKDAASRTHRFMDESVQWIKALLSPNEYPKLLDLGCGPGLYCERFWASGYDVTGVDYAKRSIDYARASNSYIQYHWTNYLTLELQETFDLITLIYCDYGALTSDERSLLLDKVYKHLRPGGKLILDVYSICAYEKFREEQTWQYLTEGGFWHESPYLLLSGKYKYENFISLDSYIVMLDHNTLAYYIWNTYFSRKLLIDELMAHGFVNPKLYADVGGREYDEESNTLAIIVEKK